MLAVTAFGVSLLCASKPALSEDKKPTIELNAPDSIRMTLEQYVGSGVTLKLLAGEELSGTVKTVGKNAVQLSQLTGKEFFDAVIPIDRIQAIIVRTQK